VTAFSGIQFAAARHVNVVPVTFSAREIDGSVGDLLKAPARASSTWRRG
jgi:hypothetical protein